MPRRQRQNPQSHKVVLLRPVRTQLRTSTTITTTNAATTNTAAALPSTNTAANTSQPAEKEAQPQISSLFEERRAAAEADRG
ncbi:MAG: hypothetical protein HY566_02380 [Candidatus Kerfeldbacteria bacterium]|nr:hypothetical protein [Candidatus Kerfeldbacteria bacterium]